MALTRKYLKELGLGDEAIEGVIAAHAATVEGLRGERDAALAALGARDEERNTLQSAADEHAEAARRVQAEFDAYRREAEEMQSQRRGAYLAGALRRAGAVEAAVPLLAGAIPLTGEGWQGDVLADEEAAIKGLQSAHAGLFTQVEAIPTDLYAPPLDGDVVTAEDVRGMTPEEINRNWEVVQEALGSSTPSIR